MKTRFLSPRLIIALLLIAVPVTATWATTREEAQQAIAEAKAMREKAAAAGVENSMAGEMIKEAQALLPSRQYTRARQIAYWAIRQDEFAIEAMSGQVPPASEDKAAVAEAMINDAEKAREKAASVGGEWRDVGGLIKEAKTLAGAGEFDKAIEVASAAKFQSERGYEQALAERNADFPDYMRK